MPDNLTVTFDGSCGTCRQPAMFRTEDGKLTCVACLSGPSAFTPESVPAGTGRYGPGYVWQGPASSMGKWCRRKGDDGSYLCVVATGHAGLCENWPNGLRGGNYFDNPRQAWTRDGTIMYTDFGGWTETSVPAGSVPYGPDYRWQGDLPGMRPSSGLCGLTCCDGEFVCSLKRDHQRAHEAWGSKKLKLWEGQTLYYAYLAGPQWLYPPQVYDGNYRLASGTVVVTTDHPAWMSSPTSVGLTQRCSQPALQAPGRSHWSGCCTRKTGHSGWHEAWARDNYARDPLRAWSKDGTLLWIKP